MALKSKILIIGGLTVLLAAIGVYVYHQYQLLYAYRYKFLKNMKVVQLSIDRVILKPILAICNISNFGFYITSYKLDVYINNKFILNIYSGKEQFLKPNGESQIGFTIDFSPKKLLSKVDAGIIEGILDTSKLMLKIKGMASARTGGIVVRNIYIETEDSLKNWLTPDPNVTKYTCP